MAIFLSVASLFEDVGLVRPVGEDHLVILSKFLVGKAGLYKAHESKVAEPPRIIQDLYEKYLWLLGTKSNKIEEGEGIG